MNRNDLAQLVKLADLSYQKAYTKVKPVLEEEQRLASRLARFDAMAAGRADGKMAAVGADLAWLSWADAERRRLLTALASARARKLAAMEQVSRAHGRLEAARALDAQAGWTARKDREKRALEAVLCLSGPPDGQE